MDDTVNFKAILGARAALVNADAILITAGAGMGVDSGLPDFRGKMGFWKAYPYAEKNGLSFSDMANARWFTEDPRAAWAFYGHRLNLYRKVQPHQGFNELLKFCHENQKNYFVFTSNVDGHFQKAGFSPNNIVECHGSIHALQCSNACTSSIWSADNIEIDIDFESFKAVSDLPCCPRCGAVARPNILMFNDLDWIEIVEVQQNNRYKRWLHTMKSDNLNLVVVEFGAGIALPTIRYTSERTSEDFKSNLIRINPTAANGPGNCISISMTAQMAIERIFQDHCLSK